MKDIIGGSIESFGDGVGDVGVGGGFPYQNVHSIWAGHKYFAGMDAALGFLNGDADLPFIISPGFKSCISPCSYSRGFLPVKFYRHNFGQTGWAKGVTKDISPSGVGSVFYAFAEGEEPGMTDESFMYGNKALYRLPDMEKVKGCPNIFSVLQSSVTGGYWVRDAWQVTNIKNGKRYRYKLNYENDDDYENNRIRSVEVAADDYMSDAVKSVTISCSACDPVLGYPYPGYFRMLPSGEAILTIHSGYSGKAVLPDQYSKKEIIGGDHLEKYSEYKNNPAVPSSSEMMQVKLFNSDMAEYRLSQKISGVKRSPFDAGEDFDFEIKTDDLKVTDQHFYFEKIKTLFDPAILAIDGDNGGFLDPGATSKNTYNATWGPPFEEELYYKNLYPSGSIIQIISDEPVYLTAANFKVASGCPIELYDWCLTYHEGNPAQPGVLPPCMASYFPLVISSDYSDWEDGGKWLEASGDTSVTAIVYDYVPNRWFARLGGVNFSLSELSGSNPYNRIYQVTYSMFGANRRFYSSENGTGKGLKITGLPRFAHVKYLQPSGAAVPQAVEFYRKHFNGDVTVYSEPSTSIASCKDDLYIRRLRKTILGSSKKRVPIRHAAELSAFLLNGLDRSKGVIARAKYSSGEFERVPPPGDLCNSLFYSADLSSWERLTFKDRFDYLIFNEELWANGTRSFHHYFGDEPLFVFNDVWSEYQSSVREFFTSTSVPPLRDTWGEADDEVYDSYISDDNDDLNLSNSNFKILMDSWWRTDFSDGRIRLISVDKKFNIVHDDEFVLPFASGECYFYSNFYDPHYGGGSSDWTVNWAITDDNVIYCAYCDIENEKTGVIGIDVVSNSLYYHYSQDFDEGVEYPVKQKIYVYGAYIAFNSGGGWKLIK